MLTSRCSSNSIVESPALQVMRLRNLHDRPRAPRLRIQAMNAEGNAIVVMTDADALLLAKSRCRMRGRATWHKETCNYDRDVEGGLLEDELGPSQLKVFIGEL